MCLCILAYYHMALFCFNPRWTGDSVDIIPVSANNHVVLNLLHLMSKIRKTNMIKIIFFVCLFVLFILVVFQVLTHLVRSTAIRSPLLTYKNELFASYRL